MFHPYVYQYYFLALETFYASENFLNTDETKVLNLDEVNLCPLPPELPKQNLLSFFERKLQLWMMGLSLIGAGVFYFFGAPAFAASRRMYLTPSPSNAIPAVVAESSSSLDSNSANSFALKNTEQKNDFSSETIKKVKKEKSIQNKKSSLVFTVDHFFDFVFGYKMQHETYQILENPTQQVTRNIVAHYEKIRTSLTKLNQDHRTLIVNLVSPNLLPPEEVIGQQSNQRSVRQRLIKDTRDIFKKLGDAFGPTNALIQPIL